mgnify:CR=1 FL=1
MHEALSGELIQTPVVRCAAIEAVIGGDTEVTAKLEFLQRTGTFKARGALGTLRNLSPEQLAAGVTAVRRRRSRAVCAVCADDAYFKPMHHEDS